MNFFHLRWILGGSRRQWTTITLSVDGLDLLCSRVHHGSRGPGQRFLWTAISAVS
jgi:hypothetical protein